MKTKLHLFALGFLLLVSGSSFAALTNPTAFNLETQGNYSFTNWPAASTAGTYPANMVFHYFSANDSPLSTATAAGDITGVYNSTSTTQTRMNGLDGGGFSFKNNNASPDIAGYVRRRCGEAVLAISTTNRTNIQVSWVAGEIGSVTPVYALTCQYRIGTSGAYTTLPGSAQYLSSDAQSSTSFGPITLPASCDDQSVVQIRWAYTYVSGSKTIAEPQLFVDDISVTSIPLVTITTPMPNTCLTAPAFLLTDGLPAGGVYSGPGVSGGTFTPSVAGTGNHTITYTYTDVNGISNFATTTIDVSMSYCIIESMLTSTSCGATNLAMNSWIYCESVFGATSYEFTVANSGLGYSSSFIVNAPYTGVSLTKFAGLQNGTTYDVTVKVLHTGVWSGAGNVCQISTASMPTTNLKPTSCGATGLVRGSYIYCQGLPGSTSYEWTFTNSSLGFSYVYSIAGPYTSLQLNKIPGLVAGQTYDVGVKATIGGVQTPAGAVCQITLSSSYLAPIDENQARQMDLMSADEALSVLIYPNPVSTNSELNIKLEQNETSSVIITDMLGKVVFQKEYSNSNLITIGLAGLNITPGIYNVSISNGSTSVKNNRIIISE